MSPPFVRQLDWHPWMDDCVICLENYHALVAKGAFAYDGLIGLTLTMSRPNLDQEDQEWFVAMAVPVKKHDCYDKSRSWPEEEDFWKTRDDW